ncbi:MAG: hypothetical protein DRR08_11925 [Candidatus Parabeggiatoa sp. nov. 2]|nr:MAG: hypothetical protein B6247_04395 [Beggiatoa sp. 4572_84]RKZ60189.1 MAG: hypothetical protein DRR08_11925 [Gammaproteobacteria bacterium]
MTYLIDRQRIAIPIIDIDAITHFYQSVLISIFWNARPPTLDAEFCLQVPIFATHDELRLINHPIAISILREILRLILGL